MIQKPYNEDFLSKDKILPKRDYYSPEQKIRFYKEKHKSYEELF